MPNYEDVGTALRLEKTAVLTVSIHTFPGPCGVFPALRDVFSAFRAVQRVFRNVFDHSATQFALTGCHSDLLFYLGVYYAGIYAPLRAYECIGFVPLLVGRSNHHGGLHTQPTSCIQPGNHLFARGNLSHTAT